MPSLTKSIPKESSLHKKLVSMLSSRIKFANTQQGSQREKWQKAEDTILAYIPESDMDAQRRVSRDNSGGQHFTTIKLPYTYALLMAAHTYWTSVFFARSPVHQFSGRHGETEQQVQGLEALIAYQVEVGEFMGPYYIWLYDAGKYGVGILEEYWEREELQFTTIQEQPSELDPEKMEKVQIRTRMEGYVGNRVANVSPFDFFPDPRVPVGRFQQGEFVAVRKRPSWDTIIKRKAQGIYMNVEHLRGRGNSSFADTGSSQLERPDTSSTFLSEDEKVQHPAVVEVYEVHVSVIPKEWGLGESDFPEKWVFTITSDYALVIGAQPHGAMHGKFPFAVLEPEVEAYGLWNRGLPEIIEPIQNTMDWLVNTHFFNVRAALNNQFILDPSKIVAEDAEDGGPGFIYRLRPEAYGSDVRSFFHQIQVQDVTQTHIGDMNTMLAIGERITGINEQILGVLATGGRKTATEVRTSTGFGVNRLKTTTEYMSATGFSQHAQRLVQTSQQYYDATKKFKIAGDLIGNMGPRAAQRFLDVDPTSIQGFFDFVPVDGTLPVDRLALANLWKELLLSMRSIPGLLLQYDLSKIFAHVAALSGVRNVNQFRIEMGSPEMLAQQADAGNLVPLRPGNPTRGGSIPAGNPAPTPSPTYSA
jgi:hypothetical protein